MAQPQVENGIAFLLLKCFIVEIVNFPRGKKKTLLEEEGLNYIQRHVVSSRFQR